MANYELSFEGGETSLSVRRLAVHDAVSELFVASVWARSPRPDIDIESIVGKSASLRILARAQDTNARLWQGVCCFMEQVQAEPTGLSTYFLRIVPQLWLTTQRRGHRIYQHLSIPDIVGALLGEWGIAPAWQLSGSYPKLEYKVQYGESDYAFVSRLLEEAGIAFSFPDEGGSGTKLTLGDQLHAGPPRPGPPIPYTDNPNQTAQKEYVQHVRLGHEVRPGASTYRDYDFRNPPYPLFGKATPKAPAPEDAYEQYRYDPGAFLVESAGGGTPFADDKGVYRRDEKYGTDLSTRVLGAIRADKRHVRFDANVVDLWAGRVFSIDQHPHPELAQKLLVTEFDVAVAVDEEWHITGRAYFADPATPYRPPLKTPKPTCYALQSATVVGPPGEEIHTDELGRVRVQFPWDREGHYDDDSSCWMRVSQGWAGASYSMFTLPRVGQEVLVAFLDGDPDVPIVAGRVHNANEPVPYKLPDNKTVSTWKSSSSPGGGGYNEIKYEDKAGLELVYVQAQRDLNQLVKRDEVERTLRNKLTTVAGTEDVVVKGERKAHVLSADHLHVEMDRMEKVDGTVSLTIGVDQQEKVGENHALEAGQQIHVKAGTTMVVEAGARLTLKGPGGFIDIHAAGIDIVGLVVKINSGGSPGVGLGAHPTAPLDAEEAQPKDTPSP
jgi:type VI secretion system secreted protein VgrG